MKKSLFLLAAMAFATASFAQTAPATATQLPTHRVMRMGHHQPKSPEQRAEQHTKMLTKKLSLSTDQQARVRQLSLAQAQESQAIKAKYQTPEQRQAMRQEMKTGHDKYQAQLQGILTADQRTKLAALKQEHKGHRGHGKDKS